MNEYILTPPPPDPNEEELKVGPIEAESAAEVLARIERREREELEEEEVAESEPLEPPADNPTFTLKQMLIVITALSVWLGVMRWISSFQISLLTGLTGVAALIGMFWLSTQENQPKIARVIWWGMLLVYITCVAATMMSA